MHWLDIHVGLFTVQVCISFHSFILKVNAYDFTFIYTYLNYSTHSYLCIMYIYTHSESQCIHVTIDISQYRRSLYGGYKCYVGN